MYEPYIVSKVGMIEIYFLGRNNVCNVCLKTVQPRNKRQSSVTTAIIVQLVVWYTRV